jgi:hypothetical protein
MTNQPSQCRDAIAVSIGHLRPGMAGFRVEIYTPPFTTPTATSAPRSACRSVANALTSSASSSHLGCLTLVADQDRAGIRRSTCQFIHRFLHGPVLP